MNLLKLTLSAEDGLSKLNNWKAYTALVRSLELSLDDVEHERLDDKHWDEYYLRDMAERFCLMFVLELVNKYGTETLVKAKFVEKWLAKQKWGDADQERRDNFMYYMEHRNNRIVDIATRIAHTREGGKVLVDCNLATEPKFNLSAEPMNTPAFTVTIQPALRTVDLEEDATGEQMLLRSREHSAEEQRLRRQHREAMVLNDGTRPIGREDIIERSDNTLS